MKEPGKGGKTNVAYTYDSVGRVVSETSGGYTHSYRYDLNGNLTETQIGGTGRTIRNVYDKLNRLLRMSENSRTTSYAYDLNGNTEKKTFPNGQEVLCGYDSINRLLDRQVKGNGKQLIRFRYGYDRVGNVTSISESYASGLSARTVENTYDKNYRLRVEKMTAEGKVTETTYTFDKGNNRTARVVKENGATKSSASYQYENRLNQMSSYTLVEGGQTTKRYQYGYDRNGNRTERREAVENLTTRYGYDRENRLVLLIQGTAIFLVDIFSRLI